jgi:YfiR/HmsC-like
VQILKHRRKARRDIAGFACAGAAFLAVLGAVTGAIPPAGAAESYSEDAVKAAYLYRFAGYIDWPADALADTPFTIAVVGAPGVAGELQRLLPAHPINKGIAQVRQISRVQDVGSAQILYVARGHADFLRSLKSGGARRSILLVTDEEGGLDSGSVLNFLTIDRRVRFEISVTAAERSQLKISSDLLSVAVRIHGDRRQTYNSPLPGDVPHPFASAAELRKLRAAELP